jgi:hypothetical protein
MSNTTNVHERIDSLIQQARGLAPRFAEETLDCLATNEVPPAGPRQQRAFDLIVEALALNAISDNAEALAPLGLHN